MNGIDVFNAIPIAILYPYFVTKVADIVFNKKNVEQLEEIFNKTPVYLPASQNEPGAIQVSEWRANRTGKTYYDYIGFDSGWIGKAGNSEKMVYVKVNPVHAQNQMIAENARKMFDNKKFIFLLVVGVVGSIISTMFYQKYKGVSIGTNIGSFVTMCYATYVNWQNINEIGKLALSGLSLSALIYSGIKYYKQ